MHSLNNNSCICFIYFKGLEQLDASFNKITTLEGMKVKSLLILVVQ